jgi:hypothetical protein
VVVLHVDVTAATLLSDDEDGREYVGPPHPASPGDSGTSSLATSDDQASDDPARYLPTDYSYKRWYKATTCKDLIGIDLAMQLGMARSPHVLTPVAFLCTPRAAIVVSECGVRNLRQVAQQM